jgi:hypothetical protein
MERVHNKMVKREGVYSCFFFWINWRDQRSLQEHLLKEVQTEQNKKQEKTDKKNRVNKLWKSKRK